MPDIDFAIMLLPTVSWVELIVRGSVVYWFLYLVFRFVLRRDVGKMGVADLLLVVLIADASQNAMAAEYRSLGDGLVLISTLIGWNFLIDWASFKYRPVAKVLEPGPLVLIHQGKVISQNIAKQFLNEDDLLGKVREKGCRSLEEIDMAILENDGEISVFKKEKDKSTD